MIQNAADCGGCDCGGSTYNDCVATEIVANSPCNSALNDFMTDYRLNLSVQEQMAIVDPGGVSECGEGFEDEAWNSLAEYFSINTDDSSGEYSFEDGVEGLCWQSLSLTQIGSHYYVKIAPFSFKLYHASTNAWIDISYPSLCMSSDAIDFLNTDPNPVPMAHHNIQKAFTNALESARLAIYTQVNRGIVPPSAFL